MAFDTSQLLTQYGATQTTLLTTTISISNGQNSATIRFPDPAISAPTLYTTLAPITGPNWLSIPLTSLPILVLTDMVGIVVSSGIAIETRTLVEKPSVPTAAVAITSTNGTVVDTGCSSWTCWTQSQKVETGFAIVLASFVLIMGVCLYRFSKKRGKAIRNRGVKKSRRREGDVEQGTGYNGGGAQSVRREARMTYEMMPERSRPGTPQRYAVFGDKVYAVGPPAAPPVFQASPPSPTPGQHPRIAELPDSVPQGQVSGEDEQMTDVEDMTATSVSTSTDSESSSLDEDDEPTLPMRGTINLPKIKVTAPTPEKKKQARGRQMPDSSAQKREDLLLPPFAINPRYSRRAGRGKFHRPAPKFALPSRVTKPLVVKDGEGLISALDEGEDINNRRERRPGSVIPRVMPKDSRRRLEEKERRNREEREFELTERRSSVERMQQREDGRGRGRR